MIYFLVTREGAFGMEEYLASWGQPLAGRIQPITYDELPRFRRLPIGSYIFSDLDRLTPLGLEVAQRVWTALGRDRRSGARLNHPTRVLRRYPLLRALAESGRNDFRVSRADEPLERLRFPVFVREENEHTGSLTELIHSEAELQLALRQATGRGFRLEDLLVVEFCDTADERGVYRKYSAYVVGDRVIPRAITFSEHWVGKAAAAAYDVARAGEEREYVERNPHEGWLREIFALARVNYGRIDYGLAGGRPQVWEINLNPTLVRRLRSDGRDPDGLDDQGLRLPAKQLFFARLRAAFETLDCAGEARRVIPIDIPAGARRRLKTDVRARRWARRGRKAIDRLSGHRLLWRLTGPVVSTAFRLLRR